MKYKLQKVALALLVLFFSANNTLHAEQEYTDEQIAEMVNNPLSHLWLLFMQHDIISYGGDLPDRFNSGNDRKANVTLIQPVMPMQLTDNWKLVFRPILPVIDADIPAGGHFIDGGIDYDRPDLGYIPNTESHSGIGDVILWTALATNDMASPPNIVGFGMSTMLDTASEEELGTGKYSAGPMALAVHVDDDWIYGVIAQHWWSFAGDSDRDNVNLTDVQYILRYRLTNETNIGMAPNVRYDWSIKNHNDRLTLPVGGGMDTIVKLGPLPVKIGVEYYKYIQTPDAYGPDWQVRFFFSPVIPSPSWSKKPLFNF